MRSKSHEAPSLVCGPATCSNWHTTRKTYRAWTMYSGSSQQMQSAQHGNSDGAWQHSQHPPIRDIARLPRRGDSRSLRKKMSTIESSTRTQKLSLDQCLGPMPTGAPVLGRPQSNFRRGAEGGRGKGGKCPGRVEGVEVVEGVEGVEGAEGVEWRVMASTSRTTINASDKWGRKARASSCRP